MTEKIPEHGPESKDRRDFLKKLSLLPFLKLQNIASKNDNEALLSVENTNSVELIDIEKLAIETTDLLLELGKHSSLAQEKLSKHLTGIQKSMYYLEGRSKESSIQSAIKTLDLSKRPQRRNQEIALTLFLYNLSHDAKSFSKTTLFQLFDLGTTRNIAADVFKKRKLMHDIERYKNRPDDDYTEGVMKLLLSHSKNYCNQIESGTTFKDISKDASIQKSLNTMMGSIYTTLGNSL
jgi:hypothetical protein